MNFLQLAKERYSVRKYKATPVEPEKIRQLLEAGRVAPTAANRQPQRFLVLTSAAKLAKLNKACNTHGAPLALLVFSHNAKVWKRPFDGKLMSDIDTTIAADHLMMAAQDLGLGSCWITYFDPEIIRREFNPPENLELINILAIGYADDRPQSPERHAGQRLSLQEMAWFEDLPTEAGNK